MVYSSKSGLLPASRRSFKTPDKRAVPPLDLQISVKPAKFSLKPYSAIINPFRHGCSILCNHPTQSVELRRCIKKQSRFKDESDNCGVDKKVLVDRVGEVLEEIFRYRREDGKLRGRTPTGKESSTNIIVADDSKSPSSAGQRTVLVLDLRRSASQDTIGTTTTIKEGRVIGGETKSSPIASPTQSSISAGSLPQSLDKQVITKASTPQSGQEQAKEENELEKVEPARSDVEPATTSTADDGIGDDTDVQRRRGKVRKKKKTAKSITVLPDDKGSKEVIGFVEPGETQVSTCNAGDDMRSGQTSATPGGDLSMQDLGGDGLQAERLLPVSDLFDQKTLRHLRRIFTVHDIEAHYRSVWRQVLTEAVAVSNITPEEEMKHVLEKVEVEQPSPQTWINYPREFAYNRARFDFPINKDRLNGMTPLEYLRDFVAISKRHNILYDYIFDKYRKFVGKVTGQVENKDEEPKKDERESEQDLKVEIKEDLLAMKSSEECNSEEQYIEDNSVQVGKVTGDKQRFILGKNLISALGEVMGREFNLEQANILKEMVNWNDDDMIDLKTWLGLCALSERIFGYEFRSGLDTNLGKRQILERVDFENFLEKLPRLNLRSDLLKLLTSVREVCENVAEDEIICESHYLVDVVLPVDHPTNMLGTGSMLEEGIDKTEDGNMMITRRIPRIGYLDDDDSDAEYYNNETGEFSQIPDDVYNDEPELTF